ncbi:MAG: tRNA lysidine(34) synthetase TilS [Bacilli bacterium]|nr:tRNA lysidine(34) synthetase TilS [Bacilli bacterium]
MKEEATFLKKILKPNDKLIIACSGGPDSMCLLYILLQIKKVIPIKIICAHINHKKRKESDFEFKMVQDYCHRNQILFEGIEFLNYPDGNFHFNSHQMRHDYFEKLIKKYQANYLVTAHHGDDLIETILMRLTRGSSFKGYAGFSDIEVQKDYTVIRPFVTTTKKEILKFNQEKNIPYCIDKSNEKDQYTRNRYRHQILPFLKEENKNVHLKFKEFHDKLCRIDEFLVKIIANGLTECLENDNLLIVEWKKLEDFLQREILHQYLKNIYQNDIYLLTDVHINNIIKLLKSEKSNGTISLPKSKIGIKNYLSFKIVDRNNQNSYHIKLEENTFLPNGSSFKKIKESFKQGNDIIRLDSREINGPLYVRTREISDVIEVKNLKGHQKVKKIFIDKKIPPEMRNYWPIVTDNKNQIIWIPGLKKSKFDKNLNEKYDIIYKYDFSKEKKYVTEK